MCCKCLIFVFVAFLFVARCCRGCWCLCCSRGCSHCRCCNYCCCLSNAMLCFCSVTVWLVTDGVEKLARVLGNHCLCSIRWCCWRGCSVVAGRVGGVNGVRIVGHVVVKVCCCCRCCRLCCRRGFACPLPWLLAVVVICVFVPIRIVAVIVRVVICSLHVVLSRGFFVVLRCCRLRVVCYVITVVGGVGGNVVVDVAYCCCCNCYCCGLTRLLPFL